MPLFGKTRCPQCAEKVRSEALICRYCQTPLIPKARQSRSGSSHGKAIAIGSIVALSLAGAIAVGIWSAPTPSLKENAPQKLKKPFAAAEMQQVEPKLTPFPLDSGVEWRADTNSNPTTWGLGPMAVTISPRRKDDLFAPVIDIRYGNAHVSLQGEMVSNSYSHHLVAVSNRAGAHPVLMLQSFSGGAHCCNSVQVAGLSGGKLKVIDLGAWDGDQINLPKDISGDGFADYIFNDNIFLYAFAPYAYSYSPPKVFNIRNGRTVDVSSNRAFRRLFEKTVTETQILCDPSQESFTRNGACPAFVAAAAKIGKIDWAWNRMVAAYDASADWQLPTGCRVKKNDTCPEELQVHFQSYPDALLNFLKENKYIAQNWYPTPNSDFPF